MKHKTPLAMAMAIAGLAATAPIAAATVTTEPLTITRSGDNVVFKFALPTATGGDSMIALFVAPAGAGASNFAETATNGGGPGEVATTGSTNDCQIVAGSSATLFADPPNQEYPDSGGAVYTIAASKLPASFDAKAVVTDDYVADGCQIAPDNHGLNVTMAGAQRFPAPVVPAPVPAPAPAPAPAPVVTPAPVATAPAADPDKDGIDNDWLVGGKAVAAPKAPKVSKVTAHGATLTLPKAPTGSKIRVYRRVAGSKTFRAVTVKTSKGKTTLAGLKSNTKYELKVVAVNTAGKQTKASKTVSLKTSKP